MDHYHSLRMVESLMLLKIMQYHSMIIIHYEIYIVKKGKEHENFDNNMHIKKLKIYSALIIIFTFKNWKLYIHA